MDFWFYYSFVLPGVIVLIAYIGMRLHERDLDRKHRQHQPGE
ncbi:hypothetical protein [Affinirhizobium pseudoryzae]|nr:hypothetical protein [Allorhizobium pseudoryzae]